MSEKLKPCPFCGGKTIREHQQYHSEIKISGKLYQLFCVNCGGNVRGLANYKEAVAAWNTRASDGLVKTLVGALGKVHGDIQKCEVKDIRNTTIIVGIMTDIETAFAEYRKAVKK